ncbi:MAG: hypothetical protein V1753_08715 [Pseudomonadota bacterium]
MPFYIRFQFRRIDLIDQIHGYFDSTITFITFDEPDLRLEDNGTPWCAQCNGLKFLLNIRKKFFGRHGKLKRYTCVFLW